MYNNNNDIMTDNDNPYVVKIRNAKINIYSTETT